MTNPKKVRLNADLSPGVADALKELARLQGISLTEALSRAISTEANLLRKRQAGAKIVLDQNGLMSEIVWAHDILTPA